jgi:hypothetical protein
MAQAQFRLIGLVFLVALTVSCAVKAAPVTVPVCGASFTVPATMPPVGSEPVVLMAAPCLEGRAGAPAVIPEAYRQYVQLQPSRPAQGVDAPLGK